MAIPLPLVQAARTAPLKGTSLPPPPLVPCAHCGTAHRVRRVAVCASLLIFQGPASFLVDSRCRAGSEPPTLAWTPPTQCSCEGFRAANRRPLYIPLSKAPRALPTRTFLHTFVALDCVLCATHFPSLSWKPARRDQAGRCSARVTSDDSNRTMGGGGGGGGGGGRPGALTKGQV